MHEWALADAVIESTAQALGTRPPSCLRSVTVLLGELQAVDREIFQFALSTLLEERPFRAARFVLETEPARFACRACARAWALDEGDGLSPEKREAIHFLPEVGHAFIRCPSCGSPDYAVSAGRGVSIKSIDVAATDACT
jgi:hydrogenase nickel incorporation protein HypA/HybF